MQEIPEGVARTRSLPAVASRSHACAAARSDHLGLSFLHCLKLGGHLLHGGHRRRHRACVCLLHFVQLLIVLFSEGGHHERNLVGRRVVNVVRCGVGLVSIRLIHRPRRRGLDVFLIGDVLGLEVTLELRPRLVVVGFRLSFHHGGLGEVRTFVHRRHRRRHLFIRAERDVSCRTSSDELLR